MNTKTRKLRDFNIIPRIIERLEGAPDENDISVITDTTKSSFHDTTLAHNNVLTNH